ncbi:CBS domain-containing protein [Streptomyces sp.]|uniref:CBS domain-containing protein n=1 Tax=Streptomyces sp. TaxID=1931 RepID=UPI002F406FA3
MRHRTVSDLMTHAVQRVGPDTAFKDIVKLLTEHGITAVPVVDDNDRPLGVVSEADLLRKEAVQPDAAGLLPPADLPAGMRARAAAVTAGGLMTSPAVVALPQWTVVQAARVMDTHQVKRLPVVDDTGRLVGIVSRLDLLRVFLRRDPIIREEISGAVLDRTLGITPGEVVVRVKGGRVTLRGTVRHPGLIPVVVRLCQDVDGVVDVTEELGCRTDDPGGVTAALPLQAPLNGRR